VDASLGPRIFKKKCDEPDGNQKYEPEMTRKHGDKPQK